MAKDPKDPSSTSANYDVMLPRWQLIDATLGGTETMRASGQALLPKHAAETMTGYRDRLMGAVFLNMVEHTLETLSGKPFSEPIRLSEDVPAEVKTLLDDVDLQGNNLDVFAHAWFTVGLAKGFGHVLVEYPRKGEETKTLEDERALGLRPYLVLVPPESIIDARSEVRQGIEVLTHVRIMESVSTVTGFVETTTRQIRVLEPGKVTLYREDTTNKDKSTWVQSDSWSTGLSRIPLVTFYTKREDLLLAKPPLLDLAYLNVAHWCSDAEQRHILEVARFPMLAASGISGPDKNAPASEELVIGPNVFLYCPDSAGKYYYVEHDGKAITSGAKDLTDLESRMAGYGAEFLKKRPGSETATATAIDSAEATSALAAMAKRFVDAVGQVFYFMAQWMNLPGETAGTITVNTAWSSIDSSHQEDLVALDLARGRGDLDRKSFLTCLKERRVLPASMSIEEIMSRAEGEEEDALGAAIRTAKAMNPQDRALKMKAKPKEKAPVDAPPSNDNDSAD